MPTAVTCPQCQKQYAWKPELAGKRGQCKCGARIEFPAIAPANAPGVRPAPAAVVAGVSPKPTAQPPEAADDALRRDIGCPVCKNPMPANAVFCVRCGYNKKTGARVQTEVAAPVAPPRARAVAAPSPVRATSGGGFSGGRGTIRIIAVIATVAFITLGKLLWPNASHHKLTSGSQSIAPGQFYYAEISFNRNAKLFGTVTSTSSDIFSVYVMDPSSRIRLETASREQIPNISKVFGVDGSGTVNIDSIAVNAGKWDVVILNVGKTAITVTYAIEAAPD